MKGAVAPSNKAVLDQDGTVHEAYVVNDGRGVAAYLVAVCEYMSKLRSNEPLQLAGYSLNDAKDVTVDCMSCIADSRRR